MIFIHFLYDKIFFYIFLILIIYFNILTLFLKSLKYKSLIQPYIHLIKKKLKTALFFGYDGSEYLGSQYNKGVKTVESVLL